MLSPQINSFKKVVPIIYCYTTPGVTYHDGWCKIGESEQDSTSRVKQQTQTANIHVKLEWTKNAVYEVTGDAFHDTDFHQYLASCGIERMKPLPGDTRKPEWFHISPARAKIECYAKTGQGWDKNLDSLCSILESELKTLDATFRFHTGGSLMKYTKKERMNIGRQIYEDQINKYEAAGKYGISAQTAREYMRMYRNTNHLPPKTSKPRDYGLAKAKVIPEAAKLDEYQKMSKEDLISALIDARIREERLKLGYEVVEEDDSKKKLITYVKKTAK